MRVFQGVEELISSSGTDLGTSSLVDVTQERIDKFADATGDHQWIHTDVERAADGPFGGTIAHGFLTLSMLPVFWNELYAVEGVRLRINYGLDTVRFLSPVPAGSRIRGSVKISRVETRGEAVQAVLTTTIEIEGAERPAAVADAIVRFVA